MSKQRKPKSLFSRWLFENSLSYTAAGELFGCSRQYVRLIAEGLRPMKGKIGGLILRVLTGEVSIDDLHAVSAAAPLPAARPPRPAGISPEGADISHRAAPCETQPSGAS